MNNIEEYDILIERFLRGEMSAEEESKFKTELKSNTELKSYAETVCSLVRGLKRKGMADDNNVIGSVAEKKNNRKFIRLATLSASIAAVFVIMFSIINNYGRQDKLNTLVTPYYTSYSYDDITRGAEDTVVVNELADLFNAIGNTDNCTEIIKKLVPIYHSLDKDVTYRPYANDIAWYLAIAYIKNDEIPESIKVLNKLINDNPNTDISEQAKKLLLDLKEFE